MVEIDVIEARGRLVAGRAQEPLPGLAKLLFRGSTLGSAWQDLGGSEAKLDLKGHDPGYLRQVVSFLDTRTPRRPTLVSSPDRTALLTIHKAVPSVSLLYSAANPAALARLKADSTLISAVDGLSIFQGLVNADLVTWAHGHDLAVMAWTVDDGERVDTLVRLGVDGITTANLAVLGALHSPAGSWQLGRLTVDKWLPRKPLIHNWPAWIVETGRP